MKLFNTLATLCIAGFSTCTPAYATDTSLYAEAAPSDASFVRFIGFESIKQVTIAGFNFALNDEAKGKYIPISSALLSDVAPGTFMSVLQADDGTQKIITEGPRTRQSKVALLLVNGTEKPLELRLADGSVLVIDSTKPDTAGQREVNPVAITLGVFESGVAEALATFDVTLRRGQNVSFVAGPSGVRMIENQFAAVAK